MTILKKLTFLLLSPAIMLLVSCEGNTTRVWKIQNNTDKVLKVKPGFHINDLSNTDTIFILEGKLETIGMYDVPGGDAEPGSPTGQIGDLFITNESNDSLVKDIMVDSNWTTRSMERGKVPSEYLHEFILELSENDFIHVK